MSDEWNERFFKRVGLIIFNSPGLAVRMTHVNPLHTLRDYYSPQYDNTPEDLADQFVVEFAKLCSGFGKHKKEDLGRFVLEWGTDSDRFGASLLLQSIKR